MTTSRDDRRIGALLGLAIGDALGAAVEFKPPGSFPPVAGYRGGGPHGLDAGEWTDDTAMALALADSLVTVGWDLDDQADRYLSWLRTGEYSVNGRCFDVGNTTRRVLETYAATGDASTSGPEDERSAGNGSIMRLAPVPMFHADLYPNRVNQLIGYGGDSSLPTHRAPQATSACAYMTLLLAALMTGEDRSTVLDPDWPMLAVLRSTIDIHSAVDEVIDGGFRRNPPDIVGSGYVVRSLEVALWALARSGSFEETVLAAVNLGDDTDTTGAVTGQLAGACWGLSGIPDSLLDGLAQREMIETTARRLLGAAQSGWG
jgi:ADP-ribosyl-[dinitrogen reductase] hydrolase